MSTTATAKKMPMADEVSDSVEQGLAMPSLKIILGGMALVALVLALGMTGGQVRELDNRLTAMEGEREAFERRVEKLRGDNKHLIGQLRDYQGQMAVVAGEVVHFSKRLENREMAINDLQGSLDAILKEKYATENELRAEVAKLENLKRDLSAQVAALGAAVAAQSQEISELDGAYRLAQQRVAEESAQNSALLAENDRYLSLLNQMQDDLDAVEEEGEVMAERFATLQSQSALVEAEKLAIQRELEEMRSSSAAPYGFDSVPSDPFGGGGSFLESSDALFRSSSDSSDEADAVASIEDPRSA